MSRIVAFVSHSGAAAALADLARDHDVTVIGPAGDGVDIAVDIPPVPAVLRAAVAIAWRSAAGRNLVRITPVDLSRRMWRAAHSDPRIAPLLQTADVAVAGDRDAVFTVWQLSRRNPEASWPAVYGANAARFVLTSAG